MAPMTLISSGRRSEALAGPLRAVRAGQPEMAGEVAALTSTVEIMALSATREVLSSMIKKAERIGNPLLHNVRRKRKKERSGFI